MALAGALALSACGESGGDAAAAGGSAASADASAGVLPDGDAQAGGGSGDACEDGARQCNANAVEVSNANAWQPLSDCPGGTRCESGNCVEDGCTPDCNGKDCGDDGCEGNCGLCEDAEVCTDGACGPAAPSCGDGVCGEDENCESCAADCATCCGDGHCRADQGEDCNACPTDCGCISETEWCHENGQCVGDCFGGCDGRACGEDGCHLECGRCAGDLVCNADGQCVDECTPDCEGKACGNDGCGGSCGVCQAGESCEADGACMGGCVADCAGRNCGDDACNGSCGACEGDDVCSPNGVCVVECLPDCAGKDCGDDVCGGMCGECAAGEFCDPDFTCGPLCIPQCQDRDCGSNNCGGDCGECAAGEMCDGRGRCIALCEPACDGLSCGDDGCGGRCGDCAADELCEAGQCRPPVAFCACLAGELCVDGFCRVPDDLCSVENPVGICAGGQDCLAGECQARGAACSGQNPTGVCALGQICRNGDCEAFDAARLCDDANPCTRDVFDYVRNRCAHPPQNAPCDDGNGCTSDLCQAGVCETSPIVGCIEPPVLDPYVSPTNVNALHLSGTKPAGAAVYINGEVAVAESPDARWTVQINLLPGENVFDIHSRDGGTDSASVVARVVYDVTAPGLTITPGGGVFLNPVTVTVTTDEPATVYFTDDGATPDQFSSHFTSVKQIRVFDDTVLRFRARDLAGNWMAEPVQADFIITGHGNGWTPGPALPEPRTLAAATIYEGDLLVLGGTDGLAPQAGVYRYDFETEVWDNPPPLTLPRTRFAAHPTAAGVFVVGGDNDGEPLNLLQRWRTGEAEWTNLAPMPSTRFGVAVVGYNNRLYVFGGQGNGGAVLPNVEVYDLAANNWTNNVAQMPRPRSGHGAMEHAGRVYLIGGEDEAGAPVPEVDVYDLVGNAWSTVADLPTPRSFATLTKNYNAGAISGGYTGLVLAGGLTAGGVPTAVVEEFVIDDNLWRERTPLSVPRHSAAGVTWQAAGAADGSEVRGLAVGGLSTADIADTTTYFTQAQDYHRYIESLPEGRFLHAAEVVDGLIYLFGGRNFQETRAAWAFDPETGRYEDLPELPSVQNGLASASFDGRAYALGGANGFGVAVATVRRYDPDDRVWTDLRAMPTSRKDLATVVVGDEIWAIGGDNNGALQTVEIFTPATNTWRAGTALPTGRMGAKAVQQDGNVYVIGGLGPAGTPVSEVLMHGGGAWLVAFSGLPVAYAQVALVGDRRLNVFGGRSAAGPTDDLYSVTLPAGPFGREISVATNLLAAVDRAPIVSLNGDLYIFGGNAAVDPGPSGELDVQKIDGLCFDGVRNGREAPMNPVTEDSGGTCPLRRSCTGTLYGDICLLNLSGNCVQGSAANYCASIPDSRVITHAEFIALTERGWVRPDGNYHTMSVDQIGGCGGGAGSVNVPGYGDVRGVYQCGDNLNYCARAVMCVLR